MLIKSITFISYILLSFAMVPAGGSTDQVKSLLTSIATVAGVLCAFAALILYGLSRVETGGDSGSRSEGKLIGCVIASISCFAAAAFITSADLSVDF